MWSVSQQHIASPAEEVELIAQAKQGVEAATMRLFESYVTNLRGAVRKYAVALSVEDAQQVAFVGFLKAIHDFDPAKSNRLLSNLHHVSSALSREASLATGGFSIAPRMVDRFYSILREAEGDPETAAKLAPTRERDSMPEATFWTIYEALAAAGRSLEVVIEVHGEEALSDVAAPREMTDAEDRILVEVAFGAVSDVEATVCRMAYGFTDYDPVPDAEIGHRLGFSRTKTLRTRQGALGKMREAIGAIDA
ncbi:sigma factor [Micromonospora sp. NPDC047730]|uniref:sigma factor n=1 Tax=Micromonospora sp. NPDC047730 TaxID=3364253 RepID=UPI003711E1AF